MTRRLRIALDLFKESFQEWRKDNAMRLAAALAYYTAFSLAPLMLVVISVAGLVLGREAASGQVYQEMNSFVGPRVAEVLQELVKAAKDPETSVFGLVGALALALFGASGVFGELKDSLNIIWGVQPRSGSGVWNFLRGRGLSILMVFGVCALLLASTLLSSFLHAVLEHGPNRFPGFALLAQLLTIAVSLALVTALFAMIFKWLPDAEVQWRDVLTGAFFTAVLFTLGKSGLEIYFAKAAVASSYGAAGGLALILVWIYYSAQIFFFGAEFTEVYARRHGSRQGVVSKEDKESEGVPAASQGAWTAPAFADSLPAGMLQSGDKPAVASPVSPPAPVVAKVRPPSLPPGGVKRLAALGALTLTGWAMEKLEEGAVEGNGRAPRSS